MDRDRMRRANNPPIDQRSKILIVAQRLFNQKGYPSTSIEDLAQSTNINRATIYYYFKSKANLLYEVASKVLEEINKEVLSVTYSSYPAEKKLELLVKKHILWDIDNSAVSAIGWRERRYLPQDLWRIHVAQRDAYEAGFRTVIGEVMSHGISRDLDAHLATRFVLGFLQSIPEWYNPKGELSPEDIASYAYAFIMRALNTHNRETG